jgi:hypothetical protein
MALAPRPMANASLPCPMGWPCMKESREEALYTFYLSCAPRKHHMHMREVDPVPIPVKKIQSQSGAEQAANDSTNHDPYTRLLL